MSIADPLQQRSYQRGILVQQCEDCDWAQRGHRAELIECPQCGAALEGGVGLILDVMMIGYDGLKLRLFDPNGQCCCIEPADVADALMFIAKHATDLRRPDGPMFDATPRRVEKQGRLEAHFCQQPSGQ